VTTYANWVAKAASLLVEEHDLERGDTLRIDLPPHWLGPVFLGAAWSAGLTVTDEDAPDAVVCGPDELPGWAERAGELPVLACSLLPLGVRFAEPVPPDVHDVGIDIWSQPDSFIPWDPPGPDDVAYDVAGESVTHGELWSAGAVGVSSPTAAASSRRRTRLPHRGSPPSRSRSHAAARSSWSRRPSGIGSRRRTPPSGQPLASLPDRPDAVSPPVSPPCRSHRTRYRAAGGPRTRWPSPARDRAACCCGPGRPGRCGRSVARR
jgi:uncharacterized protein (TIGR03089 family)